MVSSGSGDTSARPSARARAFCSSMALRTAGMPPRRSCSATGSCSGRSSASAALRWVDTGWRRRGRSDRSGRAGRGPERARARRARVARVRSGRSPGARPVGGAPRRGRGVACGASGRVRVGPDAGVSSRRPAPRRGRRCAARCAPRPEPCTSGAIAPAVLVTPAAAGDEDHRHAAGRAVAARADDLDAGHLLGAWVVLGGQHRRSPRCRRGRIGVGAQDVAHLGTGGEQGALERAPRLAGPRGAPGPGAVVAAAGQLDVDSSRHWGRTTLPSAPTRREHALVSSPRWPCVQLFLWRF